MVKYLYIIFAILLFGCGDSGDSGNSGKIANSENLGNSKNVGDKKVKNPNIDIYDKDCHQRENPELCGFIGGKDSPPVFPESVKECEDKENCL
ncbi:MAG TPA: hypothetical protein EYO61_00940 [Campylobacterales bacterium]|nr:hypothetical protein [Campylobacterales bacterium]HIO70936.1 hypothetical protein [Campylobacterales bacterium]